MKKYICLILICLLTVSLCGCGDSNIAPIPGMNEEESSVENTENNIQEDVSNENVDVLPADSNENDEVLPDISDDNDDYDADFYIFNNYEPSDIITNSTLSDGAYIQIGSHVLELGKATLKDFVNAGVDLYNTKAELGDYYQHENRDRSLNEEILEEYMDIYERDGSFICKGFLSGQVRIDLSSSRTFHTILNSSEPVIDSVMIENYAGNIESPFDYLYGGPKYQDMNSVYATGGIYFTGPVSTIPDSFGKLVDDVTGQTDDGYATHTRVFTAESSSPDYTYYCQLLSREDHCSSLLIKLKDSRP